MLTSASTSTSADGHLSGLSFGSKQGDLFTLAKPVRVSNLRLPAGTARQGGEFRNYLPPRGDVTGRPADIENVGARPMFGLQTVTSKLVTHLVRNRAVDKIYSF